MSEINFTDLDNKLDWILDNSKNGELENLDDLLLLVFKYIFSDEINKTLSENENIWTYLGRYRIYYYLLLMRRYLYLRAKLKYDLLTTTTLSFSDPNTPQPENKMKKLINCNNDTDFATLLYSDNFEKDLQTQDNSQFFKNIFTGIKNDVTKTTSGGRRTSSRKAKKRTRTHKRNASRHRRRRKRRNDTR